jgi:multidrug efflux pump subunit AcrA (membrane-fusion protein)
MKRILLTYLSAILLIVIVGGCATEEEQQHSSKLPQLPITVTTVSIMDMKDTVSVYGVLALRKEAKIASQFDGRLEDFDLLPGNYVKKGLRLGTIIPPQREALLQTLKNLPPKTAEDVKNQIKVIPLISPISGTVLEVLRHTGDVVQKGDQIVHIANLAVLDIRGDLPISYLRALRKAKKLEVDFMDYPHDSILLPVEAISGKVDNVTQTAMVRLKLQNPKREFYPGMAVKISFIDQMHKNTIVIPREALLEKEGIYSVFVLKGNVVEKRIIKPGIMQKKNIEVLAGLQRDEQVAVKRAYSLTDGMEVIVK